MLIAAPVHSAEGVRISLVHKEYVAKLAFCNCHRRDFDASGKCGNVAMWQGQIHLLDAVLQPDLVLSFAGGIVGSGFQLYEDIAMSCELQCLLCHVVPRSATHHYARS